VRDLQPLLKFVHDTGLLGSFLPRNGMTVHYQNLAKRNLSTFLENIPTAVR